MPDLDPNVKPILEMFAQQLRHPNVGLALKDWRNTLSRGMLHFGRKESLDKTIEFNTLIYTDLNPTPARSGRRITLEPKLELVGVVSDTGVAHRKFRYLNNEIIIVRATGRWDYALNEGPLDLKIIPDLTVRLPEASDVASRSASQTLVKEIGKLCFSWLIMNKMTMGGSA